jgi:hypothetical protein
MNGKGYKRKLMWFNWTTTPAFTWKEWGVRYEIVIQDLRSTKKFFQPEGQIL